MWNIITARSSRSVALFFFLTLFAAVVFQKNPLKFSDRELFSTFQKDSEALVLGRIVADDFELDKQGANLGYVARGNVFRYPDDTLDAYSVFSEGAEEQEHLIFVPYKSQYGFHGTAFSTMHRVFGLSTLSRLQSVNSVLLAVVLASLFFLYRRIYDDRFAAIFWVTMISSPWIVSFARNLYWTPFLWFVPAVLAALLYLKPGRTTRAVLLFGIALAVFVKSLAGYEYLTSITLFTCSVFVVAPFFKDGAQSPSSVDLRMFILVFVACVVGFIGALLVHADMRGDSLISGVRNIVEQDVKRRTYGDPSRFDPLSNVSLGSSSLAVVKTYVFGWRTDLVAWLPGRLFTLLLGVSFIGISYKWLTKHKTRRRDVVLLAFFFMVPVSWFVLAKGHSYVHTHLNFVLWYFGFVQALIYVAFNTAVIFSLRFLEWAKTANAKDF